jgi:AraC family transcriptional regulator
MAELRFETTGDVGAIGFDSPWPAFDRRYPVPVGEVVRWPRVGLSERKRRAVLEYIDKHLAAALTVRDLAAVAHLSPYHFARLFKISTGLPPHQYVIARRVERAKQLLRGGDDWTLAQVAARSGFFDQGHFTRHFKRLVGVTPKYFRRIASAS